MPNVVSAWYEQHGSTRDAIRHALAAEDFARAANLIELAIPAMGRTREASTLLGWLRALPDEIILVRPVLCVGYAWASMDSGELEAVEPWLQKAERWLETTTEMDERAHPESARMVVANEEELRRLPALIAIYRAGRAQLLGNVADTLKYARRVLDIVPEDVLATAAPTFVEGFLGMFTGYASEMNLGSLPAVWTLTGPLYILGGLLFGIATLRAGILSRWAAGVFGFGAMLAPAFALLPHELEPMAAVPVGIGLAWLGYALWSERREQVSEPVLDTRSPQLHQTEA